MNPNDLTQLDRHVTDLISSGLTDEEIAVAVTSIGSAAHVTLGRLVKTSDLVALLRKRIMTPEPQWIGVTVGDQPHALQIASNEEGIVFDLWQGSPEYEATGEEPVATGYMLPEDILEQIGVVPPWNQPWVERGYDSWQQTGATTAQAEARALLLSATNLLACPTFEAVLDTFDLWDIGHDSDRRALYESWAKNHPEADPTPFLASRQAAPWMAPNQLDVLCDLVQAVMAAEVYINANADLRNDLHDPPFDWVLQVRETLAKFHLLEVRQATHPGPAPVAEAFQAYMQAKQASDWLDPQSPTGRQAAAATRMALKHYLRLFLLYARA